MTPANRVRSALRIVRRNSDTDRTASVGIEPLQHGEDGSPPDGLAESLRREEFFEDSIRASAPAGAPCHDAVHRDRSGGEASEGARDAAGAGERDPERDTWTAAHERLPDMRGGGHRIPAGDAVREDELQDVRAQQGLEVAEEHQI